MGQKHLLALTFLIRKSRRILLRAVPGFTSTGHAIVVLVYTILNVVVCFVDVDWSRGVNVLANRTGWLSFVNLALITFLALRYSPLAILSDYSYERLIVLHRVAGYATIFWAIIHTILFSISLNDQGRLNDIIKERAVMYGDVATLAMLVILGTAIFLSRIPYEAFYIVHVILFIAILITLGFHPNGILSFGSVIVIICTAALWTADYLARFIKLMGYSVGNGAEITPLPNGGTRVVMRKAPKNVAGAAHCSLWVPSLRLVETHPFAVVSTDPVKFVLASYDGFTRDLHNHAVKNPGSTIWASIHGPYGVEPDYSMCDKLVCIAGGSGASFTVGIVTELLKKIGDSALNPSIDFIWVSRNQECLQWYGQELQVMMASPLVNISFYSTHTSGIPAKTELAIATTTSDQSSVPTTGFMKEGDLEKHVASLASSDSLASLTSIDVKLGRPDIVKIIDDTVAQASTKDRIAVAVCGPELLMKTARQAVARNIKPKGPSLELQCEEYAW